MCRKNVMMKICSKCDQYKPITDFCGIKVKSSWCKSCRTEYTRSYRTRSEVKIKRKEERKKRTEKLKLNPKYKEVCKEYYWAHRDVLLAQSRESYKRANKRLRLNRANICRNKRRKNDLNFKLRCILRCRMGEAVRGEAKTGSAVRDLGCSIEFFKKYIEDQFQPGMLWENWSYHTWHLDHRIPLASFDLTDREQFLKACHYTNLQPMWAKENMSKKDKILPP